MEPTEDATLRPTTVGGCVFWWLVCTEFNSNWTHNYQIHKLHATLNMMMMIVIDTLLVGDVPQNCRLTATCAVGIDLYAISPTATFIN